MKKLILILFISLNMFSQEAEKNSSRNEIDFETDTGKFVQGAFVSSFTYFTIQQFTFDSEDEWVKIPLSILTAFTYEMFVNSKTTDRKQLFVLAGAVTVNVTFEIFKPRKRKIQWRQ